MNDLVGLLAYTQQVLTATNDEIAALRAERDAFRYIAEGRAEIAAVLTDDREKLRAALAAAETRLRLARWALVQTGYFTEGDVGEDVAPRITEMWSVLAAAVPAAKPQACSALVDIKGERVPCDSPAPHTGWAHTNCEHEIRWYGSDAVALPGEPQQ